MFIVTCCSCFVSIFATKAVIIRMFLQWTLTVSETSFSLNAPLELSLDCPLIMANWTPFFWCLLQIITVAAPYGCQRISPKKKLHKKNSKYKSYHKQDAFKQHNANDEWNWCFIYIQQLHNITLLMYIQLTQPCWIFHSLILQLTGLNCCKVSALSSIPLCWGQPDQVTDRQPDRLDRQTDSEQQSETQTPQDVILGYMNHCRWASNWIPDKSFQHSEFWHSCWPITDLTIYMVHTHIHT